MEKEEKIYNKLILIGNGFDLALGLKTSYNDFLFWLLKSEILKAIEQFPKRVTNEKYTKYNDFLRQHEQIVFYGFTSNPLFDVLVHQRYDYIPSLIKESIELKSLQKCLKLNKVEIVPKNRNSLFSKILELSEVDWIDIEDTYFQMLKESLTKSNNENVIDDLNYDLENISEKLKEYLKEIAVNLKTSDANQYTKQFYEKIAKGDVIDIQFTDIIPNHIYFLNFNYTESLNKIIEQSGLNHKNIAINQIHSNVSSKEPIIFGFGDEMDDVYKDIEKLNDNRYFKFIKSFQYFKRNNYRELLRFLNSNFYQVCIYGHSCGLSDRVMLNEIFEHTNCKSIKIYHYNNSDYTSKTMNISRHFNSNKSMREKIVNFNVKDNIHQLEKD